MIYIALPKGRMAEESLHLFQQAKITSQPVVFSGRKLSYTDEAQQITFYLVRSQDVPTYVESGAADFGIVGKDVLVEQDKLVYELLDLKIGYCRISLARNKDKTPPISNIRVATKYPRITEKFFIKNNQDVEIIKLYGSIELAPLIGLAHYIVDLVSTGLTLKENNLEEMETIFSSTGRLIANRSSYAMKNKEYQELASNLKAILLANK